MSGGVFTGFFAAKPFQPVRRLVWRLPDPSPLREYAEVGGALGALTLVCWFTPLDYHALGHVYLLAVIALSLRVGRLPVLAAALGSALAWNYFFVPPQLSFSVMDLDDSLLLATYLVASLISGELTSCIREQARAERLREQRATALFHLTHALAAARSLGEAAHAARTQAEELFNARTTLLLALDERRLIAFAAGSDSLNDRDRAVADWAWHNARPAGRFTPTFPSVECLHVPMLRAGAALGVLVFQFPPEVEAIAPAQRELMEAFAAQIALLVERERLRAASEREKLFQESDRLHRTLLDSVSHELKTPLAVLRTAAEKCDTDDAAKRAALTREIRTATSRLDHLVTNLLSQTRLDAGRLESQLDWCDVRDILFAVRRTLAEALASHPLTLEIADDFPLFRADALLTEQVIANLLLNAALHTPAGTPITIRAGVDDARSSVFISVIDRGPGVPAELLDDLFKKFHRGARARPGGLGLGLSIVKGFMQAQEGGVSVANNPVGGATFTLHFPRHEPEAMPCDER